MATAGHKPALTVLRGRFALHRFADAAAIPDMRGIEGLCAWVRSPGGVTLVCDENHPVDADDSAPGWKALEAEGPLDFALTGILAGITSVLAGAGVSVFAISTWETDYVLVRSECVDDAADALRAAGYRVAREAEGRSVSGD